MSARRPGSFLATAAMIGALLASGAAVAQARTGAAQAGGTWHNVVKLQGPSGQADVSVNSVDCPSPGNCLAGGSFAVGDHVQAMVVTEHSGHWARAVALPGITKGATDVASVSCASPGNCTADGESDAHSTSQPDLFVISEVAGRWGQAHLVPGDVALEDNDHLATSSLSCPSQGNCIAGGSYEAGGPGKVQAFVLVETNGKWSKRVLLSGAGLRASHLAQVEAVSCSSAGNCVATGTELVDASFQLFAVTETGGHWGQAVTISASGISTMTDDFIIDSMSCYSPGNCAVGGGYNYEPADSETEFIQPFVISEIGGKWGPAMEVPGLTRPSPPGNGWIDSLSCVSSGACTASGTYPTSKASHAFVVTATAGNWSNAVTIARSAAIDGGRPAEAASVSCSSTGDCVAGGYYVLAHSGWHPFLVTETSGHWGQAQPVPGAAKLSPSDADHITAISCPSDDHCTAVGSYDLFRAFAATEN